MKLDTRPTISVKTSGGFQELNFGIRSEDMGLILEILRSKMYKDPVAAICREISSNSRDANREVGKKNVPVKISVDKSLLAPGDLTISFIDEGPGISPERMADVFVNYGASTKRDSNNQTGAFGLGAKTPFAYSDSFSIVTTYKKITYTYIAAIEKNNTGKIYLISEEKLKKSKSGTSIIIPVDDLYTFESEIVKTTYFWKVRPKYINFEHENPDNVEIKKESFGDNFLVGNSPDYYSSGCYLLIDEIPYRLDTSIMSNIMINGYYTIFLTFKTGQLTISANREAVQYDELTKKKITLKYETFINNLKASVEKEIKKSKSYIEATLAYLNFSNEKRELIQVLNDNNMASIKYDGKEIDEKARFKFKNLIMFRVHNDYNGNKAKDKIERLQDDMIRVPIFKVDTFSLNKSRDTTTFIDNNYFYTIEFVSKDLRRWHRLSFKKKKHFAKQMRAAIDELNMLEKNGLKLHLYSKVKQTKVQRQTKVKIEESIYIRVVKQVYTRRYRQELTLKPTYIKISDVTADKDKYAYHVIDSLDNIDRNKLKWAFLLKSNDIKVIFIRKKYEKDFVGHILELDKAKKKLDSKKMKLISDKIFLNKSPHDYGIQFKNLHFVNGVSKSINYVIDLKKIQIMEHRPLDFDTVYPPSKKIMAALNEIKDLKNKYPLLKLFEGNEIKAFNEYIELMDGK